MSSGMRITWGKAGVLFAALTVLQGMGYFVHHSDTGSGALERLAAVEAKVDGLEKHLQTIETCLLDHKCGR